MFLIKEGESKCALQQNLSALWIDNKFGRLILRCLLESLVHTFALAYKYIYS